MVELSEDGLTKENLVFLLNEVRKIELIEAHYMADALLLKYINDSKVSKVYNNIEKYYG